MMELTTASGSVDINDTADLLVRLNGIREKSNEFAVLAAAPEEYVQAAGHGNAYVIEKRSGTEESHCLATHVSRPPSLPKATQIERAWWQKALGIEQPTLATINAFTFDEMIAVFTAYLEARAEPDFLRWESGYS